MIAFLAVRRQRQKAKQEISVQQLNQEQQQKQEILEKKKEVTRPESGCWVVHAFSWMLLIVSLIFLIPLIVYRDHVFLCGFVGFFVSGSICLFLACCCNDCCLRKDTVDIESEAVSVVTDETDIPYHIPCRLGQVKPVMKQYNLPSVQSI